MNRELMGAYGELVDIMKNQKNVLGAWNFGSITHEMSDEYSDVDIIFLIEGNSFEQIDKSLCETLEKVCDEIIICWPEGFNSNAITNYGYLLKRNNQIFQFDVFLLNNDKLDDFMCRIHYTDLKEKDVVFDKWGNVKKLIYNAPKGTLWREDIENIIVTYWFHANMTIKYLARKDYFKLNNVLRIMMDTHSSLLLTAYDKITWGGQANKLHFIDKEKQEHLKKYSCLDDFNLMKKNLLQAINWFENDVMDICNEIGISYNENIGNTVKDNWIRSMDVSENE